MGLLLGEGGSMRRIVLVALLSIVGSSASALARGPHLSTPQLGAGDCTAERSHCQQKRAVSLTPERLSCPNCSTDSSLKSTLSTPSGLRDEACPDAQASLGPT